MTPIDWLGVETEYRKGLESNRKIAKTYGISEAAIRRQAKKHGWVRDNGQVKRERVRAHFAGIALPEVEDQPEAVVEAIEQAASDDIRDMDIGLDNARLALGLVNKTLRDLRANEQACRLLMADAKNLKLLTETNRLNIDTIRKIRGLDEPGGQEREMSEAEIDARIAELRKKL
ncbi:hypothetical protein CS022_22340 [Veronia nyctiphanis]|uniref:Terminase small subunit n=1 Tax=Veronia nyctiphanis TaxID=1278244 RepID=A0A4Q0YNS3_9GAMM|nr:hypothetical protein [Veronia nyctiphanis]RXJ70771.1 hypothetical protein CS022_22340 [Veronia nyctiphanis]